MSLLQLVTEKRKLHPDDLDYVVQKTDNARDYMFLNYIEREAALKYDGDFAADTTDKVRLILSFILEENMNGLYAMYQQSFDIYFEMQGRNINVATNFNTMFIILIHIALKIARKNKTIRMEG